MRNLLYSLGIYRRFINRGLILIGSISFLFFMSLKPLSNREIIELSQDRFNINMSGFQNVLSSKSIGKWFELETALCLNDFYNEKVLGFSLDINITDTLKNYKVDVLINDSKIELRTTEYDVVTDRHLFECKSGGIRKRTIKISQFIKERNLIEWFNVVKRELIAGSLNYKTIFNKKGRRVLVINGITTLGKDICLTSSWLKNINGDYFYNCWSEIIELISTKKLILIFKRKSSDYIISLLQRNNFFVEDCYSYKKCFNEINQFGANHLIFHHDAL